MCVCVGVGGALYQEEVFPTMKSKYLPLSSEGLRHTSSSHKVYIYVPLTACRNFGPQRTFVLSPLSEGKAKP